jgi:hypothetical protein
MSMSMSNLPPEHVQGTVVYRSGGIGHDEAAAMRKAEAQYPLSIEFIKHAKPTDEHLANVSVTIKDEKGTTELSTISDGPILLAKLPPGKYTIAATDRGLTKMHDVVIAAKKPERVIFDW